MQSALSNLSVTIVVAVADRFSCTPKTLDEILNRAAEYPFDLIFVDGSSPQHIQKYLDEKVGKNQLKVIRSEHYLSPSQSRNMGAAMAESEYILFIDNDVFVEDGWLKALVQCAKETDADVITPLVCIGEPIGETIHLAGGETHIEMNDLAEGEKNARKLYVKHHFANQPLKKAKEKLKRQSCSLVDLHCVLVKKQVFEAVDGFDESLLNTREHVDFCLRVQERGFSIYCEPDSVVTYVPGEFPNALEWSDIPYFSLRWSDSWEKKSLNRFIEKWDLAEDNYFRMRFKKLGQYRKDALLKPIFLKLRKYRMSKIEKPLAKLESFLNNYFYNNGKAV